MILNYFVLKTSEGRVMNQFESLYIYQEHLEVMITVPL